MGETPPQCTKCQGLLVWEDEECYRCFCCGKRYFPQAVPVPLQPCRSSTRSARNPVTHREYMRAYMRAYRSRQRKEAL